MRMRRHGALVVGVVAALVGAACQPGTPETAFGDGGTVVLEGPAGPVSAAPAAHGAVVVVTGDGELVKVAADGAVVAGWGGPPPVPCAERDEVERDDRGRYLLTCTSTAGDGTRATDLVRYTARGRLDRRFGTGGVVRLGALEGAAAVPLPGGGVLALGGRPFVAGQAPVLVTTVLDGRGRVTSTAERELDVVEDVPQEYRSSTAVTVVAEPLADGAVVAVHASILLTVTDAFRPTDPFLLVFDREGAEVARLDGPPLPNGNPAGSSIVRSMAEVAPGRIAVLETQWELLAGGPRPSYRQDEYVHVYRRDGTEERQFTPMAPATAEAPDGRPFTPRALAATGGGRHLLLGGAWAPAPDTWQGGVARYDTATWALDPTFGTDGMAGTGSVDVRDLDPREDGPAQIDATGVDAIPAAPDTPAAVTRLWNPPPA
jgi:hypothetical protein